MSDHITNFSVPDDDIVTHYDTDYDSGYETDDETEEDD
jgi:hypothetical protein